MQERDRFSSQILNSVPFSAMKQQLFLLKVRVKENSFLLSSVKKLKLVLYSIFVPFKGR